MSVIVRILQDNQYRLEAEHADTINAFGHALESALISNDAAAFSGKLDELVTLIKKVGHPLPHEEIVPSDVILPPADCSLAEFKQLEETHTLDLEA